MPDTIKTALLSSLVGGGLNAFLGKDDEFKMSPEARKLFDSLSRELGQFQGFKPAERTGILDKIKGGLQDELAQGSKRSQASQVRRGVFDPGTFTASQAETRGRFGEAFGGATKDVDLASFERDRQQKNSLRQNQLSLLSGQQFVPGSDSTAGIGDLSEILSYYMNQGKTGQQQQKKPNLMDIFGAY